MTEPLVPADCDLRGLPFMPLQVQRLLDSDLFAISTGDEFKAAVALWCKSWGQVPAGSLPNDERVLAHLASAKNWKRVREMALRNWVLCSDGRLYHPLVAQNVLEAWERRSEFREVQDNKDTRQQRWREKVKRLTALLRDVGVAPPQGASLKELSSLCATHVDGFVDAHASTVRRPVDANEMSMTGDSDRDRDSDSKEKEDKRAHTPAVTAGNACKAMRSAGMPDVNPSNPKLKALLDAGITVDELTSAAADAVQRHKGFAYALATAEGRRRDGNVAPLPGQRAAPTGETAYQRTQRERMQQWAPEIAARAPGQPLTTIETEALDVAPRRLG